MARIGDGRGVYRVLVCKSERERDHLENLGVDGRTIVKCFKTDINNESNSLAAFLRVYFRRGRGTDFY